MRKETIKTKSLKHLFLQRGRLLLKKSDYDEFAENLIVNEFDKFYEVTLSKSGSIETDLIEKKSFKFYIQVNKNLEDSDIQIGNYETCDEFLKKHYEKCPPVTKKIMGEGVEKRLFYLLAPLNLLSLVVNSIYLDNLLILANSLFILYIFCNEKNLSIPILSLPVLIYAIFKYEIQLQNIQIFSLFFYALSQYKNIFFASTLFLSAIYALFISSNHMINVDNNFYLFNIIAWLYVFYYWIFYGLNDKVFFYRLILLLFIGVYCKQTAVIIAWILFSVILSILIKGKIYVIPKRKYN